ncbi:MAG TPA: N-acetylmuramoyl-L-alanine amidase [Vicinamibacterales bacterium]|nr:N-acetylmuramoyl-L-alanine amidase [Vicinamibacterales bacterium]
MKQPFLTALVTAACLLAAAPGAEAQTARDMYNRALAQERSVRDEAAKPTLTQMRRAISAYEAVVRRHPSSGYADNALWQAANLASLAFERFGSEADRKASARLLDQLARGYPSSRLAARQTRPAEDTRDADDTSQPSEAKESAAAVAAAAQTPKAEATAGRAQLATLRDIKREVLPDGVRVTVDLDSEVPYYQEEIANPRRLFFDLKGVRTAASLQDASLKFADDVVKEVRLGRHPRNVTRLVVDLDGVSSYSVYPLYGPYRLVIDFRRAVSAAPAPAPAAVAAPVVVPPPVPAPKAAAPLAVLPDVKQTIPEARHAPEPAKLPSSTPAPKALPPAAPASNSNGKFSLSRQLGLSVARIVLDAGHGGHDPGAHGNGITESELTLDVAQRLRKLLEAQPGMEVVMTRDTDVFIPLEERTAIANREGADLFLSIHANASRNSQARGIETYFLSFALNPEAEAVAARENATSAQTMHNLPDIVKAIALNNKLKESRDLAETVQKSMTKRLSARNRSLRDLGVKQAPFVVLIGAVMPSVLAEISFVTNRQEGALLKTTAYRQQIAQALFDAIQNYQQSLKRLNSIAGKKATAQ